MWNIPSMADGQGRALGLGSNPGVPPGTKIKSPEYFFERNSVENTGFLCYIKTRAVSSAVRASGS